MFEHSTYTTGQLTIQPDEVLAIYSDGITEAENAAGRPFDEEGLENALKANRTERRHVDGHRPSSAPSNSTAPTRVSPTISRSFCSRRLAIVAA